MNSEETTFGFASSDSCDAEVIKLGTLTFDLFQCVGDRFPHVNVGIIADRFER